MTPEQRAREWLLLQGVYPVALSKMSGYTHHVFLVEQTDKAYPAQSVLRLANSSLPAGFSPLAFQGEEVVAKHRAAEQLGLAPPLISTDSASGVMWLAHAGEQIPLGRSVFHSIRDLLDRLHSSDLVWGDGVGELHRNLMALKQRFSDPAHTDPVILRVTDNLLRWGKERDYFNWSVVAVHSDLNPGNWLHDGKRWWLIDWDYAGLYPREWDYAGLIVEHGWDEVIAAELLPEVLLVDLAWFCCLFALLSWAWHCQRGSDVLLREAKRRQIEYWVNRCLL